jgi:hypothetical protein
MGRRGPGRPASPGPSGCSCSGRPSCCGSVGTESRPWRPPRPGSGTWSCSPSGAERNRLVPHRGRGPLGASPMAWTFIWATSFLQNRSITHASEVRERDEFWVPAGRAAPPSRTPATSPPASTPSAATRARPASRPTRPRSPTTYGGALAACPGPRELHPRSRAVLGVACPRTGPEVAFKQGHSTLPPTRASPDNESGIG